MGASNLANLEFGEIRRVAQRNHRTRQIFINNVAIRRATQELKSDPRIMISFGEFLGSRFQQ